MNSTNRNDGDRYADNDLDGNADIDDEDEDTDEDDLIEDRPQFRSAVMAMNRNIRTPSIDPTFIDFSQSKLDYADIGNIESNSGDHRFLDGSSIPIRVKGVETSPPHKQFDPAILHLNPDKSSSWEVNKPDPVPFGYSLHRGYRELHGTVEEISGRISDCLRERSIQAIYDKDKALAKCKNADFVLFHIRLFTGSGSSIIVHVHRMDGCGFSFKNDCLAILDAAENIVTDRPEEATKKETADDKPLGKEVLEESLQDASKHLVSEQCEKQMFGLRHIAAMTDSSKASDHTVREVSQMIMKNSEGVRKSLAELVVNGHLGGHSQREISERNRDNDVEEQKRHAGLQILANIMKSTADDGTLDLLMKGEQESQFFTNMLMPALLGDVRRYEIIPHTSALAAKCLSFIFDLNSSARKRCENTGSVRYLENATRYGARCHARLQEEAANAIRSFYQYQD